MKKLLALLLLLPALAFGQSYTAINGGVYWPYSALTMFGQAGTSITTNAAGNQAAMCGTVYWDGRPASKTIDTTAKIAFSTAAAVTFANAGTTIDLGFQSANTSGPIIQPNGTFLGGTAVKRTLTGGTDTITGTAWNEYTLSTAGTSFTLSQGQLVCVVANMTARGGADTVNFATGIPSALTTGNAQGPITNANTAGAWQTTVTAGAGQTPIVVFTASDGTLGTLGPEAVIARTTFVSYNDGSNPDEYAQSFQLPFAAKVDALWTGLRTTDANSNSTLTLYSTCTGTPTSLASVTITGSQVGIAATESLYFATLSAEVSLAANTTYCVGLRATHATSNVRISTGAIASAAARVFMPGGTDMQSMSRQNGGSTSFGAASSTVMLPMGVRVSAIAGGASSGGGVY